MKPYICLLAMLFVTAAWAVNPTSDEQYKATPWYPELGYPSPKGVQVRLYLVPEDTIRRICGKRTAVACSSLSPMSRECNVYIPLHPDQNHVEPNWLRSLGHEVAHCFYGRWHTLPENR